MHPNYDLWSRIYGLFSTSTTSDISSNYWGTTSLLDIDHAIWDFYDDGTSGKVIYQPILTTAPETAWPFVVDIALATGTEANATRVGAELVTFSVTFNRDMDATVQPAVSFGPAEPYTDYTIQPLSGGWANARTWKGTFRITPLTGDGYQILRVANARAASDPWLVTGVDDERFKFEIVTSGAQSMNLQATGDSGYVGLSWMQDDFELLAGYNLYRSTSATGTFTRVNSTIIPGEQKSFQDVTAAPGVTYFYKFTVVKTDFTESGYSNTASGAARDGIAPTVVHTPVTSAQPGNSLSIFATITDNIAVTGASVFYRAQGSGAFTERAMTKGTGDRWGATFEGSAVVPPGLDYYISATDGVTVVYFGRPENPYPIAVVDAPVLNTLSPLNGTAAGGTAVTLAGSNFKAGATVLFGGSAATNVTVVSANQITATTPAHYPANTDVVVRNSDGRTSTLLGAFTFISTDATVSLPTVTAGQNDVVALSINGANLTGLLAADITVSFDPAVIRPRAVTLGALTTGWSLAQNLAISGQVTLSMAGSAVANGSGSLASLEFDVLGSPGQSTSLTITRISLNGSAISATTAAGGVDVQQVYRVGGTVRNWKQSNPLSAVQIALTGDRSHSVQSGADGSFAVTGVAPGSYTLRPSRTGDDRAITAYDASLVLQHAGGVAGLTGNAALAADVDKSGAIDSMDASYILQRAAQLIELPFPRAGATWEFAPTSRNVAVAAAYVTGQDFVGTLLGDVSGSWGTTANGLGPVGASIAQAAGSVLVRSEESLPSQDGWVTATISLSAGGIGVFGVDLLLTYDAAMGTPMAVSAIDSAKSWLVSSNLAQSGEVRIAMASATAITGDSAVLSVNFKLLAGADRVNVKVREIRVNEALPIQVQYALNVAKSGTGAGTITDPTSAIACGARCSAYIDADQVVTLTATPSAGANFAGWSGACSGTGTCTVTMDAAKRVTATFGGTASQGQITAAPVSLAFGGQSMNTTSPAQVVTISNPGSVAVTVVSVTPTAPYAVRHSCDALAAGASCQANVTFTPSVPGSLPGTLTIVADVGTATVTLSGTGERSLVTHYYGSILRRPPDDGGKAYWESIAATLPTWGASTNETWYAMAMYFYFSAEYLALQRDDTGFITDLYRTFFNREPDSGGLDYWNGVLTRGTPREVVLAGFMFSPEFVSFTQAIFGAPRVRAEVNVVMDFYRGLLARLPDRSGFDNWLAQIRAAQCTGPEAVYQVVDSISQQFLTGGEYVGRGRSNKQFVGDLYNAFLRRGGDEAGVAHWVNQLNLGNLSREQERQAFLGSGEFNARVNAVIAEGCMR